jgi:hypothetical protein
MVVGERPSLSPAFRVFQQRGEQIFPGGRRLQGTPRARRPEQRCQEAGENLEHLAASGHHLISVAGVQDINGFPNPSPVGFPIKTWAFPWGILREIHALAGRHAPE